MDIEDQLDHQEYQEFQVEMDRKDCHSKGFVEMMDFRVYPDHQVQQVQEEDKDRPAKKDCLDWQCWENKETKEFQAWMEEMDSVVSAANRESRAKKDFRETRNSNHLLVAPVLPACPDFLACLDFPVLREKMDGLETKDLEVMIVESVLLREMVRKENQETMDGLDSLEETDFLDRQDRLDRKENVAIVEVLVFPVLL